MRRHAPQHELDREARSRIVLSCALFIQIIVCDFNPSAWLAAALDIAMGSM